MILAFFLAILRIDRKKVRFVPYTVNVKLLDKAILRENVKKMFFSLIPWCKLASIDNCYDMICIPSETNEHDFISL